MNRSTERNHIHYPKNIPAGAKLMRMYEVAVTHKDGATVQLILDEYHCMVTQFRQAH